MAKGKCNKNTRKKRRNWEKGSHNALGALFCPTVKSKTKRKPIIISPLCHTLHDKYAHHKSQETENKKSTQKKRTEEINIARIKTKVEIKKNLSWHCIRSHTVLSAKSAFDRKESEQTI